ncbi:MAG: hypothetical protein U5K00_17735 [Melioribacteraceae bacterium]|nr:hypothetical protein [Melioribacteraceae bacterium]
MKKLFIILSLFLFAAPSLYSQHSNTGIGIMIGEPTGISAKHWLTDNTAFAGGLGWHFIGKNSGFNLHLDYLYHIDNRLNTNFTFPLYYGFGARIRQAGDRFGLGFRGVGGILFFVEPEPIDIFFEIAPVFRLLPNTDLDFDIALGARYYF